MLKRCLLATATLEPFQPVLNAAPRFPSDRRYLGQGTLPTLGGLARDLT